MYLNAGPLAITRTLIRDCIIMGPVPSQHGPRKPYCKSLAVLKPSRFYPLHYSTSFKLLSPLESNCNMVKTMYSSSIAVHWWQNVLKKKLASRIPESSVFGKIMRDNCPISADLLTSREGRSLK